MPNKRLTEKTIRSLAAPDPSGKQTIYWDHDDNPRSKAIKGFGVLCSGKTNARTFICQREIHGRTRRVTLCSVAEFEAGKKTLEQIRKDAADLLEEMRKGIDTRKKHRGGVTLRDRMNGDAGVEKWLEDWLDMPLNEITEDMVEKRHKEIQRKVAKLRNGVESFSSLRGAATANLTIRAFGTIWNRAAADKVPGVRREDNPILALNRKDAWFDIPERDGHIKGDDLPAFYNAVKSLPSRTMKDYLLLILFTGLRRREASSLRWADIDFSSRIIRLPAKRTKSRRRLNLPMSNYVFKLLTARRALGVENEFVFAAESRSGYLQDPRKALEDVARMSSVRVSVHDLRRTYVTIASMCRIPPMALPALVNHSLGNGQTARYSWVAAPDLADAAEAISRRMHSLCVPRRRLTR